MSDYTITTDFGAKDSLPSGNAAKIIKGSEFTTEFTNIKTAIATKANTVSPTFTGNTALDGATTFGANGTSTFNGTVNFTKDVTFDTNTLFVDVSENRVGIGNVAPATALDVTGVITTDGLTSSAGIDITGTVTASGLTVDTNTLHVDATNNRVGIGTASPANTLTVGGLEPSANDQDATVGIKCNANHRGIILQENSGAEQWEIGVGAAGALKFYDSGSATPAVTFADGTGNVGIGTDSPVYNLVVNDSASSVIQIRSGNDDAGHLYFADADDDNIGGVSYSHQYNFMNFKTNDTERMRIDSSGYVGIGTSSPDSILDVVGADPILTIRDTSTSVADSHATLRLAESDGSGNVNVRYDIALDEGNLTFDFSNGTATSERMRIDALGNVLVGRTSGSAGDEDNGIVLSPTGFIYSAREGTGAATHIGFINNTDATATTVGTIRSSGSTTSYNTSSDERLKENITDSADAGSKVDAIQIRQFDWKADGSHQDYGVIAQELINVAPEAVSEGDTEEDMMGVDYSKLVPMLIKEVQSLRSRVAELENV